MIKIAERVKRLKETISSVCARVGREPAEVKLVVVTKSASQEAIEEVLKLGLNELGENRVQQLKKVVTDVDEFIGRNAGEAAIPRKVTWHMIGHLQRNKVRQVLPLVSLIHSVDTLRLAEEINPPLFAGPKVRVQLGTGERECDDDHFRIRLNNNFCQRSEAK